MAQAISQSPKFHNEKVYTHMQRNTTDEILHCTVFLSYLMCFSHSVTLSVLTASNSDTQSSLILRNPVVTFCTTRFTIQKLHVLPAQGICRTVESEADSEGILGGVRVEVGKNVKMYRLQLRIQFKILTRYSKFKALVSTMP
jgi:hypothetical protein